MPPTAPITPKGGVNHIQVDYLSVLDEALGAGWNGSVQVPTKNAVYDAIAALGIQSGTYTPTLTNTTNIASSTPLLCNYVRSGGVCTVYGIATVAATTANVECRLTVSLPIPAASWASTLYCLGGAFDRAVLSPGIISGDASLTKADLLFTPTSTTSRTMTFIFGYQCGGSVTPLPFGSVSDAAYSSAWDGVTTIAPSKNAVYDAFGVQGTYTPTFGGITGITGGITVNAGPWFYHRTGQLAHVWGQAIIANAAVGQAGFTITLPPALPAVNFTSQGQCVGHISFNGKPTSGAILAQTASPTVASTSMNIPTSGSNLFTTMSFTYQLP